MFPTLPRLSSLRRRSALLPLAALIAAALALLSVGCATEPAASGTTVPPPTATRPANTLILAPIPTHTVTLPPNTSTPMPLPTPTATLPPAPALAPLVFLPEDEAPHETPIEWWYFNGFLRDEAGNEYSYHFVTFQSPTLPLGTPHLLHATLSDHGRGVHAAGERGALATVSPGATGVDIATGGWAMRGDGESYELRFDLDQDEGRTALELRAVSRREPLLHDSTGLVDLGEAGSTYYYSRTRMELSGWLEDAMRRRPVTGAGWMDHQWGEIASADIGWDWVNLHLDDGADLMLAVVWQPEGRRQVAAYATHAAPGGTVTHVPGDGVSLEALGSWVSPETGIEYPMGWRAEISSLGLLLELTPFLEQAEFAASVILPVAYWEGAVSVSGTRHGAPIGGRGFVELVGYDPGQLSAPIPTP